MKKMKILILAAAVFSLFLLTGCNTALRELINTRDQNVVSLIIAQEQALELMRADMIKSVEDRYIVEQSGDMMITVYERLYGMPREEAANQRVFSINDVVEFDRIYDAERQIAVGLVNSEFDRFNGELTSSSASIEYMNSQIDEIQSQREQTIREAMIGTAVAVGVIGLTAVTGGAGAAAILP